MSVVFEGGIAANNFLLDTGKRVDLYFLGYNREEFDALDSTVKNASPDGTTRLQHIKATMAAQCFPNQPPTYQRPRIEPKAVFIKELGPALTSLCWTCRRPVEAKKGFERCGECKTCVLMDEIEAK